MIGSVAVAASSLLLPHQAAAPKDEGNKVAVATKAAVSTGIPKAWTQEKAPEHPGRTFLVPDEEPAAAFPELRVDSTQTAERKLGFTINVPKSPWAAAAGKPEILADGNADRRQDGDPLSIYLSIRYPNGLRLEFEHYPPDSEFVDFASSVERTGPEIAAADKKGYMDGSQWQLTQIAGHKAMEIQEGFNYYGSWAGEKPDESLKEPRGPIIVWYDSDRQAKIYAKGPARGNLRQLHKVVESMY